MVKSQPMLPMRVMSRSVAMQWQTSLPMSMVPITTRDHGDVPGLCSCLGSRGCLGAVQNWTTTFWFLHSEELLLVLAFRRVGPVPRKGSRVELALVAGTRVI